MRQTRKYLIPTLATILATWLMPYRAAAGTFELSLGGNYRKSNYTDGNYSWTRTYGASFGYHFSEKSGIEFSYQDIVDRTRIEGYEDTTFHDEIYSASWIQELFDNKTAFQPYFKLGVGQLNREATGSYAGGGAPPKTVDQVTGVVGAGLRLYILRRLALRLEATSYLSGGAIGTWKDNISAQFGFSLYL
jgi:hypothetical protein